MAKSKQKTHKGASKRFKITASGKVLHRAQKTRHLIHRKSAKKVRHLKQEREVKKSFIKKIKQLLGLA